MLVKLICLIALQIYTDLSTTQAIAREMLKFVNNFNPLLTKKPINLKILTIPIPIRA